MKTLRSIGKILYAWWMKFASVLAIVNTTLILVIFYTIGIGISAIIIRLLRKDLLDKRIQPSGSFWKEKEPIIHSLEHCRRQF